MDVFIVNSCSSQGQFEFPMYLLRFLTTKWQLLKLLVLESSFRSPRFPVRELYSSHRWLFLSVSILISSPQEKKYDSTRKSTVYASLCFQLGILERIGVAEGGDYEFEEQRRNWRRDWSRRSFCEEYGLEEMDLSIDKTISILEMELAAAKSAQELILNGSPLSETAKSTESVKKRKYLMVVGINTAFSSRKRRDSVRTTWMPQGMILKF
ncbi:putative beta-1,3-galactosyltransferase 4 [Platanthera guangdongensis]|uniref:Beta-1,3-galactosyltransferase 4 n=1 Tax=Platanthera guangdongensis TaxID=2320717 RepID=A0ABR2MV28_9ASPA